MGASLNVQRQSDGHAAASPYPRPKPRPDTVLTPGRLKAKRVIIMCQEQNRNTSMDAARGRVRGGAGWNTLGIPSPRLRNAHEQPEDIPRAGVQSVSLVAHLVRSQLPSCARTGLATATPMPVRSQHAPPGAGGRASPPSSPRFLAGGDVTSTPLCRTGFERRDLMDTRTLLGFLVAAPPSRHRLFMKR